VHGVGDAIVGVLANPLDEDTVLESADAGVPDEAAGEPAVESADVGGWKIRWAGAGQDGEVVLLVHGYGATATPGCPAGAARPRCRPRSR
jgi:hypothetical protein